MKLGFLAKVTEAVVESIFEKMLLSKNCTKFSKKIPTCLTVYFFKVTSCRC